MSRAKDGNSNGHVEGDDPEVSRSRLQPSWSPLVSWPWNCSGMGSCSLWSEAMRSEDLLRFDLKQRTKRIKLLEALIDNIIDEV